MITKRDCILLLSELAERGIDTSSMMNKALRAPEIDLAVVKFINEHRQFDANAFYEKLRKTKKTEGVQALLTPIILTLSKPQINAIYTYLFFQNT